MPEAIDGTAGTEQIAGKLTEATDELEDIAAANAKLQQEFENHEWSGLDDLAQARTEIDQTRDELAEIARKVGVAGETMRDAYQNNQMVGNKQSLGRA